MPEFRGNLDAIFSDLSSASKTGRIKPKSAMAADIITIGDSWLTNAISKRLIEPIHGVEEQDWFQSLDSKWKVTNNPFMDPLVSLNEIIGLKSI